MNTPLLNTLENSKQYTLSVANLMPDSSYDFKPTASVWSFGELLHHIAYGIQWWEDNYIKDKKTDWAPPAVESDKKKVIACLEKSYAALKKTLSNGQLSDQAVQGFHATLDHITHHRGQAVTYLRCKGITPPEYTY